MGYTTRFKGDLKFAREVSVAQLRFLGSLFDENVTEQPEWAQIIGRRNPDFHYIDLEVTETFDGIKWSGAEKSYDMVGQVNFVVAAMRLKWPEFGLTGSLIAQGEESDDAWTLTIGEDGVAVKTDRPLPGVKVRCPDCRHEFRMMPDGKPVDDE